MVKMNKVQCSQKRYLFSLFLNLPFYIVRDCEHNKIVARLSIYVIFKYCQLRINLLCNQIRNSSISIFI